MRFDTNGKFYFCGIVLYSLDPKLMNEGLFGYGHGLTIVYRLTSLTLNPSPPISTPPSEFWNWQKYLNLQMPATGISLNTSFHASLKLLTADFDLDRTRCFTFFFNPLTYSATQKAILSHLISNFHSNNNIFTTTVTHSPFQQLNLTISHL